MSVVIKMIYGLFFLNSSLLYAQGLDHIKSQDTIYIFFDGKKNQEEKEFLKKDDTLPKATLFLFVKDINNRISFYSDSYLNFEDTETNKKADIKTVDRKFLRRNRRIVLNIDFFLKYGFKETYYSIYKKHIYLIEGVYKKSKFYTAKEVLIDSNYHKE